MALRHFPVRPNLSQLKHQAKDLLRDLRAGEAAALSTLREFHPKPPHPMNARLADAQLALARSYGLPNWPRLVTACVMTDAIWHGDVKTVRDLVTRDPRLLREDARGIKGNWGPPMSYAANVGQDEIIHMLRGFGADDVQFAFGRACLQGKLETARRLYEMGARPTPGFIMGPCETLSGSGLAFLLDLGAEIADEHDDPLAPIALLLETYSRGPEGKHHCLEILAARGVAFPDTPPMAVHRGRLDLLKNHLRRDSGLFERTFSHEDIFPRSLGCHEDESLALHGTPLVGATLMHLAIDYDEMEILHWLLDSGADSNVRAAIDADGFGGHTPLFGCVVSQPHRNGRQQDASAAKLLLDNGADPTARASLRKRLRFVNDESLHEYRDVTPLTWGTQFHDQDFASQPALRVIAEYGETYSG